MKPAWKRMAGRKAARRGPTQPPKRDDLDPALKAIVEASLRRNRKALERLAKL